MRYGIMVRPDERWSVNRERWGAAERLGFDHAWTLDHLSWSPFRGKTWFASLPTLAAAAELTSRIGLGVLVASPNFRHPVPFAHEVMTLDDLSGGRVICGIGAGTTASDASVLGHPELVTSDRTARFREFVELTDRLLTRRETTSQGRFFSAHEAQLHPGCVQAPRVPMVIAATGPVAMRVAARYARTWVTYGIPGSPGPVRFDRVLPRLREQLRMVDEACAAEGREALTLGRMVVAGLHIGGVLESVETFREASGMMAELGVTDMIVHWPREEGPFAGRVEVLEDIAAEVLRGGEAA